MDFNQIACTIIANAGNGKSDAMAAIEAAKAGKYDEAVGLLLKSESSIMSAHEVHTCLLVQEANEEPLPINFLLVHASNHLAIAQVTKDMAAVFVDVIREVKENG